MVMSKNHFSNTSQLGTIKLTTTNRLMLLLTLTKSEPYRGAQISTLDILKNNVTQTMIILKNKKTVFYIEYKVSSE